ncbi:MAG: TIGR03546 family protein [Elusimicrobia bacterium]|jgi:uncharacterized protein (TIGR03546 family)|nr:TIGR03546 family protein [Elusimicrobiota bacterium]
MIWFKLIKKLIKALNADAEPGELAGGVILGLMLGLTPAFALHNLIVIGLIIILNVNISAAIFSSILFGIIGLFIDPLSGIIGEKLLLSGALQNFWTAAYNIPVIPLTGFNNTVVLGSFMISLILMVPLFILSKKFIVLYREKFASRVEKFKIVKLLKASKLYKIYARVKL